MRIVGWFAGPALAAALIAGPARADADPRIDKADQLFAEGKALLGSNLIQACDKFEESLQYNPAAIGTLLNVALCDEKLGKLASAIAKFTEARDHAKEQNLAEHVRAAEDHIAALGPSVPHLAIQLTEQLPETTILIDDRVIPRADIADIAIDPGERIITVNAPDRLPHREKIIITRAEHRSVTIPALARSVTVTSSRRRIGQIATIAGGAAFGTSIGLALYGRHLRQQQLDDHHCAPNGNDGTSCDPTGQSATTRARTYGNVATVVGAIGLAAAAAGTVLWITAPQSTPTIAVIPDVSPGAIGLTALGRF
jgi:tetratricopeptide (TPR) repeat protein